jgi:hypothetical protein
MLKSLLAELKRRYAVRVASVYVMVASATLRGAENFGPALGARCNVCAS